VKEERKVKDAKEGSEGRSEGRKEVKDVKEGSEGY
jgi:hypothetical protein